MNGPLVQLHTYVTLALNDEMKCLWEDPVEKMAEQDTNKNKPPKLLERLGDQESEAEVTEDIDTILAAFNSPSDREEILKVPFIYYVSAFIAQNLIWHAKNFCQNVMFKKKFFCFEEKT